MTYYVYGTYIEKVRYKFKTKKEAQIFEKHARKKCPTSFDWVFLGNEDLKNKIESDDGQNIGLYDFYNQCSNVAKENFHISKPIKNTSLWNRLQHYIFFFIGINKISRWQNKSKKKIWSDSIPFRKDYNTLGG